jgi:hypothetical protein
VAADKDDRGRPRVGCDLGHQGNGEAIAHLTDARPHEDGRPPFPLGPQGHARDGELSHQLESQLEGTPSVTFKADSLLSLTSVVLGLYLCKVALQGVMHC